MEGAVPCPSIEIDFAGMDLWRCARNQAQSPEKAVKGLLTEAFRQAKADPVEACSELRLSYDQRRNVYSCRLPLQERLKPAYLAFLRELNRRKIYAEYSI